MKKCPKCSSVYPDEVKGKFTDGILKFCGKDGERLEDAIECLKCGTVILKYQTFCIGCGIRVRSPEDKEMMMGWNDE